MHCGVALDNLDLRLETRGHGKSDLQSNLSKYDLAVDFLLGTYESDNTLAAVE